MVKILALAGSVRRESFNRKLLSVVIEGARGAGAEVTRVELADYPMPLFDQDFESAQGLPDQVLRLQELFLAHHGLLIASPEYNSSITPLLKNTLDWVSRPAMARPSLACFVGKTAALVSASPGALGGLRGLVHLRAILGNVQVLVVPEQISIPMAHEAFDAAGEFKDPKRREQVQAVGARLAKVAAALA